MLQRMVAEMLFDNQTAANAAGTVLAAQGFAIETLPWVDEYEGVVLSSTVWIKARIDSELTASKFFTWVADIIEPLHGWLYEAGLDDPPQAA